MNDSTIGNLLSGLTGNTSSENSSQTNLQNTQTPAPQEPVKTKKPVNFISVQIDQTLTKKVKALSIKENLTIRVIVEAALKKLIANYEAEKGELPIMEKPKGKGDASSLFGL